MNNERKYHNRNEYKLQIELESFGLALDYLRKNATILEDKELKKLIDNLVDALLNEHRNIFKRGVSKEHLKDMLVHEIFHFNNDFGENAKTISLLKKNLLIEDSFIVDGCYNGYFYEGKVKKGDGLLLINHMKGFGTKEAYERFVGIINDLDKPLEELIEETLTENAEFEVVVRKLIKNEVSLMTFQVMIEAYIKRNLKQNTNLDIVAKFLAKGFNSVASQLSPVESNFLTDKEAKCLSDINPRILFNITIAKKMVGEGSKVRENGALTSEQHYLAINDQIRNLEKLVHQRKTNITYAGSKEGCYLFDVVDYLMANRYSIETLRGIIKDKIKYFEKHPVYRFYASRLEHVLRFLKLVERNNENQTVIQSFSYLVDGEMRPATKEEVDLAVKYLKDNAVAVNAYTVSIVLRRLIIGGDINSKFSKNCLQIRKESNEQDDIPVM